MLSWISLAGSSLRPPPHRSELAQVSLAFAAGVYTPSCFPLLSYELAEAVRPLLCARIAPSSLLASFQQETQGPLFR